MRASVNVSGCCNFYVAEVRLIYEDGIVIARSTARGSTEAEIKARSLASQKIPDYEPEGTT